MLPSRKKSLLISTAIISSALLVALSAQLILNQWHSVAPQKVDISQIKDENSATNNESTQTTTAPNKVSQNQSVTQKQTPVTQGTSTTTNNQINVLSFGAQGDGTHDNLAAFNGALAAASKLAVAEIVVPKGRYFLSDGIVIDHPNITLRMDNQTEIFTTKPTTTGGTVGFLGNYKKVANTATYPRQNNANVIGGIIWNSGNGTADNALGFARYENVTVDGTTITQCGRKGITPQYGFSKIYIKNVKISNCAYAGISLETDIGFVQISNVQIRDISGAGTAAGYGIESISQDINKPIHQVLIGSTSIVNTGRSGIALRNNIKNQVESVVVQNSSQLSYGAYAAIYTANTDANRNIETKLRDVTVNGTNYGWAVATQYGTLYERDPIKLQKGVYGVYTSITPAPKPW